LFIDDSLLYMESSLQLIGFVNIALNHSADEANSSPASEVLNGVL